MLRSAWHFVLFYIDTVVRKRSLSQAFVDCFKLNRRYLIQMQS